MTHTIAIEKNATEFEKKLAEKILTFVGTDENGNDKYSDLGIEELWTKYINLFARGENF
jgi:hypothetical protein